MRGEEWKSERRRDTLRGYCAIIPNTTKTRINCLHMSSTFYVDDIPQSKYPFSKIKKKKKKKKKKPQKINPKKITY